MKLMCRLFGHKIGSLVIDHERRQAWAPCLRCDHRQPSLIPLPTDWIGWASGENSCPLCMGWKPRAAAKCKGDVCDLNPNGVTRI